MDPGSSVFIEGPYGTVAYRATGPERGEILPQLGDILEILLDRRLVIAGYRESGSANELVSPPLIHAVLDDGDYTGEIVDKGLYVLVRDFELSGDPDKPLSVWCRVAPCDEQALIRAKLKPRPDN